MGLTKFPHGILATPILGSGNGGYGLSTNSTTFFVDGSNGSDSNDGESPEAAVSTIGKAISLASANDVIYVTPKTYTTNEYGYPGLNTSYAESCSIAYAKSGLAIVGVGNQGVRGTPHSVVLRETASGTSANMLVYAPFCAFENLAFERGGSETGGQLVFQGGTTLSKEGTGSVFNCYFYYGNGSTGPGTTAGALLVDQAWGIDIQQCHFIGCRRGIYIQSGGNTTGAIDIGWCYFASRLAGVTDIEMDIYLYLQGSETFCIHDIYCAHEIPAYSGGVNRYVRVITERCGLIANCYLGSGPSDTALTQGHNGTGIQASDTVGICNCYTGTGALMAHA